MRPFGCRRSRSHIATAILATERGGIHRRVHPFLLGLAFDHCNCNKRRTKCDLNIVPLDRDAAIRAMTQSFGDMAIWVSTPPPTRSYRLVTNAILKSQKPEEPMRSVIYVRS